MSTIQCWHRASRPRFRIWGDQALVRSAFQPSGAADPISLRLGNRLVGNDERAAGLEMMLLGGTFIFPARSDHCPHWIGFRCDVRRCTPRGGNFCGVGPGQTLRMGPTNSGARCYLCVHGGIAVEPFLGSASTHVLSGLGGFEGRPLRKGDVCASDPHLKPGLFTNERSHSAASSTCSTASFCA